VQYALPSSVAGSSTLQLRWGLSSNPAQNDIGWHIDDVEILGDGVLDTSPPTPSLSVADLTLGGSPSHACSVTYTDDTAVRLASLDSTDLAVVGPNSFSNLIEFIGADLPSDGSSITGTYSIPGPGGTWDPSDNGTYTITLLEGAVEDTLNNATPQATLGSFDVSISTSSPGLLEVLPVEGLGASGSVGGPFSPSSQVYTLTNSGESSLTWAADQTQDWVSLSSTEGTLKAGAFINLTLSINANAEVLGSGTYLDTLSVVNTSTGYGNTTRPISLTVTEIFLSLLRSDSEPAVLEVIVHGQPFQPYVIEISSNLVDWTAVVTNTAGEDGMMTYQDSDFGKEPRRFYRAKTD
jgi:hypothetical protein